MRLPKKLSGSSVVVTWGNSLIDWVTNDRLVSVVGGKLQQTTAGRVLTIDPGGGGGGLSITRLLVKEIKDDYLVCHSWDGTTEGTDPVYVAKNPKLRNSVTEETLDGVDYEYTYTTTGSQAFVERVSVKTTDNSSETQRVVPRFILDDEIFAIDAQTSIQTEAAEDITLIDLNLDARAWAAQ
jgi:hypothetical protein